MAHMAGEPQKAPKKSTGEGCTLTVRVNGREAALQRNEIQSKRGEATPEEDVGRMGMAGSRGNEPICLLLSRVAEQDT